MSTELRRGQGQRADPQGRGGGKSWVPSFAETHLPRRKVLGGSPWSWSCSQTRRVWPIRQKLDNRPSLHRGREAPRVLEGGGDTPAVWSLWVWYAAQRVGGGRKAGWDGKTIPGLGLSD